jgi:hypothetical protein
VSVTITTDVFCDECSHWAHFGTGTKSQTGEALRAARAAGWTVLASGRCTCPKCNGTNPSYWGCGNGPPMLAPAPRAAMKTTRHP